jgi:glycosyltransferase involved in cell wall biosynthesis
MKLLISAYACSPQFGSEHAVGWNWITTAHRLGHEVWAFASPAHRASIEASCTHDPALAGIKWFFPEVPFWPLRDTQDAKWERTHNLFWQIAALRMAKGLVRCVQFDAVHHLTWGGVRAPTFLGALGVPLIIGPIGGGEVPPASLRKGLQFKARLTEFIRDLSNATVSFNPMIQPGLRASSLIIAKTPASRDFLPRAMQRKSMIFSEITLQPAQIGKVKQSRNAAPRLLFVGRLLYWKGGHIALDAFAHLRQHMPESRLSIVGKGPEAAQLKKEVTQRGLQSSVDFVPWLPRDQVTHYYESHDLLVFPSLHDSSGNAVLEALSRGLPVMCLDIGGPCEIVTPDCGLIVSTTSRTAQQVAQAMADDMLMLFADPTRLFALSAGAIARASQFTAADRVARFYALVTGLLQERQVSVGLPMAGENAWRPTRSQPG